MIEPSAAQVAAGVAAAHAAVARFTSFDVSRFIKEATFDSIIAEIITAAMNVPAPPPNQPLAP